MRGDAIIRIAVVRTFTAFAATGLKTVISTAKEIFFKEQRIIMI
jgi:hypothetical protein